MPEYEREDFLKQVRKMVKDAGYDTDYYFIEDKAGDVPYYFYTKKRKRAKKLNLR